MILADDLFAGAGGWDLAAERLDFTSYGVENMKEARATRKAAGLRTQWDDVWTFCPGPLATHHGLIASPPCQTFSQAGKGKGREALDLVLSAIDDGLYATMTQLRGLGELVGDERTALVLTPLHFATKYDYSWVCLEQVPTVLPVWERVAFELNLHGYYTWCGNLQAEQYGVPQTRKRAVLIASKAHPVGRPEPTHSKYYPRSPEKLDEGVKPWVSMAEALGWGLGERPSPTITGGGVEGPNHGGAEPIAHLVERWTTRPDWCHDRPSTTIVGTFQPEVVAAPGYRTTVSRQNAPDSVRVTVQEAGILQSFPADFPWQGAKGKQYLQCGNAIPPLLAEAVIREAVDGR